MEIPNIETLVANREAFNAFVYTALPQALNELKLRASDIALSQKLNQLLEGDIPPPLLEGKPKAVMFRQIATPNYEIRRFLQLMDGIHELDPLFGEYSDDTFVTINEQKRYWGRIKYCAGFNRFSGHTKLLDFKHAEGKRISDLKTLHGKSLVDFHHGLFEKTFFPVHKDTFYNISNWLARHGKTAKNYYKPVLVWFLQHAILFENFVLNDPKERQFVTDVFLPAFIQVYQETGYKPLIVDLLPTDIEDREFWFCHPEDSRTYIESDILSVQ